jgi:hypothetical protein
MDTLCLICGAYWDCEHQPAEQGEYIAPDSPTYRDLYGNRRMSPFGGLSSDDLTQIGQQIVFGFTSGIMGDVSAWLTAQPHRRSIPP